MKLTDEFDAFMTDTVNLNTTRLNLLDERVATLYGALCADDDLRPVVVDMNKQGSWAHETIIKPIEGNEFDADFMLVMEEEDGWVPRQYIGAVYDALRATDRYKDKVTRKDRCVRVQYANECHIDIVPYLELADGRKVIVNFDSDNEAGSDGNGVWEETHPAAFTKWMKDQDDIANGHLRRTIRLMKYLRDHHMQFKRTKSVILTVVLGERVSAGNKVTDPAYYSDLPTAFTHILEDLDAWMRANPILPELPDPSGANNNFNHRWTQASYDALAGKVETIATDARAALDCDDREESLGLWQRLFGDDFKDPSGPPSSASAAAGAITVPGITTSTRRPSRSGQDG